MEVKVIKGFYHDRLGKVNKDQVVDITDSQAKMFLERGAVELYETKVVHQAPAEDNVVDERPRRGRKPKVSEE